MAYSEFISENFGWSSNVYKMFWEDPRFQQNDVSYVWVKASLKSLDLKAFPSGRAPGAGRCLNPVFTGICDRRAPST